MRPLVARIDTAALSHNLAEAKRLAGAARVLAVIKANGYGHGLLRTARAMRAADGFAVLTLDEAGRLREAGYGHPIVLLEGFFRAGEIPEIARHRLQPVIHRADQIDALARAQFEHEIDLFLKVDSGMHRLGFQPEAVADALRMERVQRPQDGVGPGSFSGVGSEAQTVVAGVGINLAEELRGGTALVTADAEAHDVAFAELDRQFGDALRIIRPVLLGQFAQRLALPFASLLAALRLAALLSIGRLTFASRLFPVRLLAVARLTGHVEAVLGQQRLEHELAEVVAPALVGVLQVAGAVHEDAVEWRAAVDGAKHLRREGGA